MIDRWFPQVELRVDYRVAGPPPFIDTPEDEYPVVVVQGETNRTVLIVQAAAYTKYDTRPKAYQESIFHH